MNRLQIIKPYIKDKDVLDIGSIGCGYYTSLFKQMKPYCKSITGTDILKSNDNNIIQTDMQDYNLNNIFDVIIAGDVIEHLSNQGMFINNMALHIKDNGVFIITTPNAKSLYPFITFMAKEGYKDHTLWHDRNTIANVLKPYFKIEKIIYYAGNRKLYALFNNIPIINHNQMLVISRPIK